MAELLSQLPPDLDVENMVATALKGDNEVGRDNNNDAVSGQPAGVFLKLGKGIDGDNDDASSMADSDLN